MTSLYSSATNAAYQGILATVFYFSNYQSRAQAKREEILLTIPSEWLLEAAVADRFTAESGGVILDVFADASAVGHILSPAELELTGRTSTSLLASLAAGEITSEQVTLAVCKRAAIANQLIRCCTELMFADALERARECDAHFARTGQLLGPLHGLPISIKDLFNVMGYDSTLGFIDNIGNRHTREQSTMVTALLDLGAVIFCKTNIPQTMMTVDSDNNVFGRCLNPLNTRWTAGGSTGGSAALIKAGGGSISIGTDIGGSIRLPAMCCGIYGFKPTALRFPSAKQTRPDETLRPGAGNLLTSVGPMASSMADVNLLLESVLLLPHLNQLDLSVVNVRWRPEEVYAQGPKPLRIGVILDSPAAPLHPPVARIMREAAGRLETSAGIEVVYLTAFPDLHETFKLCYKFYSINVSGMRRKILAGFEPPVPSVQNLDSGAIAKELGPRVTTLAQFQTLNGDRLEEISKWNAILSTVDCLMTPAHVSTATPHDSFGLPYYTAVWNLCDFPALVIPFGAADKALDTDPYIAPRPSLLPAYDPEVYHGGPGHVQLVCRNMEDEKLAGIGLIVDAVLHENRSIASATTSPLPHCSS